MIEKIIAYKTTGGDIIADRRCALRFERRDFRWAVLRRWIEETFNPRPAGETLPAVAIIPAWQLESLLNDHGEFMDAVMKNIEKRRAAKTNPPLLLTEKQGDENG